MKTIVTHHHPDVDAVTSVWLLKTFLTGWEEADIAFVPAGETLSGAPVDSDEEIIHVDTGLGRFDHHQTDEKTCAARIVFEDLRESRINPSADGQESRDSGKSFQPHHHWNEEALDRLTMVVVDIDHFGHVDWPNPTADIYDFTFESILDGLKLLSRDGSNDREVIEWGMRILDGIYHTFVNKVWAEHEIKEKGIRFETPWGKGIALETINDDVVTLSQKMGYMVAVRKDPHKGYVRIKGRPGSGADFTQLTHVLQKEDPNATWFLHVSKLMVLNGSTKNPKMKATTLPLERIVEIIKNG